MSEYAPLAPEPRPKLYVALTLAEYEFLMTCATLVPVMVTQARSAPDSASAAEAVHAKLTELLRGYDAVMRYLGADGLRALVNRLDHDAGRTWSEAELGVRIEIDVERPLPAVPRQVS